MLISVIMPAYRAERYLAQAIESVLLQTYMEWELIIIDDASDDGTGDIAKRYASQDKRIHYLKNSENKGVSVSRNRGVAAASGEWTAFLDSDDQWDMHKLEKQIRIIHEKGARFIFSGSSFMNEYGNLIDHYLSVPYEIDYRKLLKQNVISCSSVLVQKSLVVKYPMQGEKLHEDFAVWLQILKYEVQLAYGVNEPLLIYRISSSSKSGNKKYAALMTWRVYRYIGLPVWSAFYYWCCYARNSLKKYKYLNKNGRRMRDGE